MSKKEELCEGELRLLIYIALCWITFFFIIALSNGHVSLA